MESIFPPQICLSATREQENTPGEDVEHCFSHSSAVDGEIPDRTTVDTIFLLLVFRPSLHK
jgi:hypothetical protein